MSALKPILLRRIAETGPMTLADYMADCLMHPEHGYYATRDPFGMQGDFTTAPEISQMFGELLGLALVQTWMDQGRPDGLVLTELGPGRGTLMADILRATAKVPGFAEAASVHLVETSSALQQIQAETIAAPVTHHDSIATLPDGPLYLVANEFFDALPIRQYQRDEAGWREKVVTAKDGQLIFGLTDPADPAALSTRSEVKPGQIVEHCPALPAIVEEIGQRIARHGGAALIIDYGDEPSLGDTFQTLRAHDPADPLDAPGEADLTAHVDFEAIARAASPARTTSMIPQGVLLERLGIAARAETLARNLTGLALSSHIAAHRRLTHPQEMGTLFKAIALYPDGAPPPPGFDP